jgi:diguanylate cyclase (GGDEF)-like protein
MLSPGAGDLALVRGRPAVISVKPIVPESDAMKLLPGDRFVHVSIVYLDRAFIARLSRKYALDSGRYALINNSGRDETALVLRNHQGRSIGHFIWKPFQPGDRISTRLAPALVAALLLIGGVLTLMTRRLRRSAAELRASEAQAQHLAFHDALTGLPNRALFDDRLDQIIATARRADQSAALLYIDLDRFKQINDTLGHPAGDELIREVARRLSRSVREVDTVARLGGDEFAVIQAGVTDPMDVEIVCSRIIGELSRAFDLLGGQSFIGCSIGIAMMPDDAIDRTELMRKADIALYRGKVSGRGRHVFFSPTMDATVRAREEMER